MTRTNNTEIRDKQTQIENEITPLKEQVVNLLNKLIDLRHSMVLANSSKFTIEEKNFGTKKKPDMHQVKIMYYQDYFYDEDTKETLSFERARIVEIDGNICNELCQPIKYWTIDNI